MKLPQYHRLQLAKGERRQTCDKCGTELVATRSGFVCPRDPWGECGGLHAYGLRTNMATPSDAEKLGYALSIGATGKQIGAAIRGCI